MAPRVRDGSAREDVCEGGMPTKEASLAGRTVAVAVGHPAYSARAAATRRPRRCGEVRFRAPQTAAAGGTFSAIPSCCRLMPSNGLLYAPRGTSNADGDVSQESPAAASAWHGRERLPLTPVVATSNCRRDMVIDTFFLALFLLNCVRSLSSHRLRHLDHCYVSNI